jgi:GTPase SAR1 family protein
MPSSTLLRFKIVLAGGKQVGKSSIAFWLQKALGLHYVAQSPPTRHAAFDVYQSDNYILLDTKENIQYPLGKRYYKNTHILLACFNADRPETLDALRRPINEILDHSNAPIIFLINNQKTVTLSEALQSKYTKKLNTVIDLNNLEKSTIYVVNGKTGDDFEPLAEEISMLNLKNRLLKKNLQKYISRIESHADQNEPDKINFSFGFHFFKSIRAKNREANYRLAKKLLKKINQGEHANDLLPQAENLRKRYQPHWFFNHGIQSRELNNIIKPTPKKIDKRR